MKISRPALSLPIVLSFGLSMFSIGAFFLSLSPALPAIGRTLHANPESWGLPGTLYGLSLGAAALGTATVLDRFDRRIFFYAGLMGHAAGVLTITSAKTWLWFVVGWALCGIGAGLLQPAAYAMISDATTDSNRARALGRVNVGWAAATLIGVPISAILFDALGWRSAMALYVMLWLFVCGLSSFDLLRRPAKDFLATNRVQLWSRRRFEQLHSHRLHWVFAATVLVFIGFYGTYSFLGVAVAEVQASGASLVGLFVGLYGAGFLLGTTNAGLIDRLSPARVLSYAAVGLALILLLVPLATKNVLTLGVAMVCWGICQVGAFTSLTSIAGAAPADVRGLALALNAAAVMIGAALGSGLMGIVMASAGYQVVGIASALATLCAAGIAFKCLRKTQGCLSDEASPLG